MAKLDLANNPRWHTLAVSFVGDPRVADKEPSRARQEYLVKDLMPALVKVFDCDITIREEDRKNLGNRYWIIMTITRIPEEELVRLRKVVMAVKHRLGEGVGAVFRWPSTPSELVVLKAITKKDAEVPLSAEDQNDWFGHRSLTQLDLEVVTVERYGERGYWRVWCRRKNMTKVVKIPKGHWNEAFITWSRMGPCRVCRNEDHEQVAKKITCPLENKKIHKVGLSWKCTELTKDAKEKEGDEKKRKAPKAKGLLD
jgi:hypothetical protein